MLAGEALRAAETWPAAPSIDALPAGPGGFLILAPHSDDESIGCGGLIAESVARDRPVRVVVLSDGAASHPNSATFPPPRLAALRMEETRAAVAELGLDPARDPGSRISAIVGEHQHGAGRRVQGLAMAVPLPRERVQARQQAVRLVACRNGDSGAEAAAMHED